MKGGFMEKWQAKKKRHHFLIGITAIIFGVCMVFGYGIAKNDNHSELIETDIEMLGKYIFWDKISEPQRMGCVTCHNPKAGWTFGVAGSNKHQVAVTGADPHTVGSLKVPSNAYATFIEPFRLCGAFPSGLCGGNFWNGRSEGNSTPLIPGSIVTEHIGDEVFRDEFGVLDTVLQAKYDEFRGPTAEQALNPFGNTVEQNIDRQAVCQHVASSKYAALFEVV